MKNKTASLIYLIIGIISSAYFITLMIANFSFIPSFSDCWLLLGVICFTASVLVHKRTPCEKYVFLSRCRKWIGNTVKVFLAACVIISLCNLVLICTPKVSDESVETDYLIMLGGGINQDGTLAATPRKRLEKAVAYMKLHPSTMIIVSGGKGDFLPCAEASVLAEELIKSGINSNRILVEDKARDTIQNFSYSAKMISVDSGISIDEVLERPIMIVTSRFHLRRAFRLAKRMGFENIKGLAARTPFVFVVNCYCREICSYIKLNLRILLTGKPCRIKN